MLKSILTVGGWTMGSRLLGFLRDMLIAASLGAGPIADAFFIALKLPNLFRRLFGEGAFNAAFVPAFASTLAGNGAAQARALAERMSTLMTLWLTLLTVLGMVFMPQVLHVLAPGFTDEPVRFGLAVEMTRITFPYLVFICLTALISGVLNGLDRFAAAAGAPVLFNILSMAALFALAPYTATPGHALAWGVTVSGAAQLLLVWVAAARAGMPLRIVSLPRITPEVRLVLRRMGPGLIGAGVTQLNLAVDLVIASLLPAGAVSYLYYADRIGQLPLGVIGAAVGTAMLPLLAKQLRGGQALSAHRTMNRALELSLALALPAAAAQSVLAWPIISALFLRGAFGELEAAATAAALTVYALGLPAFILVKAFVPGFFARGDTATPVKISLVVVVLNLALNLVLTRYLAHVGIALATGLSAWVNVAILAVMLRRRGQWRPDRRLRRRVPRLLIATLAMAAVLVALRLMLPDPVGSTARLVVLAVYVVAGLVTYFGLAQAIGALHLGEIRRRGRG
ncbi:murein biosynthesis integral membrane protein MurJ [Muricoccus pecuniae]|uniref:Probable lipid II flippase MurJ n=1 Tax=Muricoccus pecuniae TaxID=693023 RepID=A0A840Y1X7_9PROT|nr:murein biosynthesis integral membrane protein MurJ [Roseomonas pecuniae]MBB5694156.1 putative peptidoglycan lipid II flippase [Roseomonas pecuniae]